jgi:List-Bact-rpt repeat protein
MPRRLLLTIVGILFFGSALPVQADPIGVVDVSLRGPRQFVPGQSLDFTGRMTVAELAVPLQPVTIFVDGEPASTVLTDSAGRFAFSSVLGSPPREHVLQAVAYDATPLETRSPLWRVDVITYALKIQWVLGLEDGLGTGRVQLNPASIEGCASDDCSRGFSYAAGTSVTLTAVPDAGSKFYDWGQACSGSDPVCTITMSGDRNATVHFGAASPELFVQVRPLASPVHSGDPIGFDFEVGNGGSTAHNAILSATLPSGPGLSWAITGELPGCTLADGTLTCMFETVPGGIARYVRLTSDTQGDSAGTYATNASLTAEDNPEVTAEASITVLP